MATESPASAAKAARTMAVARVPQGFDMALNVNLLPGGDFQLVPVMPKCEPRQRDNAGPFRPVGVSDALLETLKASDEKVTNWLAADPGNPKLFFSDPVAALAKAGVELSRDDVKSLTAARRTASATAVLPPGVKLTNFAATAAQTGPNMAGMAGGCSCDQPVRTKR